MIPGTFAIDNDGTPLWNTGLGHNDPSHVANIDPSRPRLEVFYGIETNYFPERGDTRVIGREADYGIVYGSPKHGVCLVDGATGEIIWGYEGTTFHVHGIGMVANIDSDYPGMESFAGEAKGGDKFFFYSADGKRISDENIFGTLSPLALWWDDEETKEVLVGPNLFKFQGDTLQTIEGRMLMIADLFGDWREEIVTGLPGELRIYSTNITANNRKPSRMQNRQYRLGVVNATTSGYYSPPNMGMESEN